MTPEQIERMAREAMDFEQDGRGRVTFSCDIYGAIRFAALVQAAERERCARVCDDYAAKHGAKDDDDSKAQAWMMLQCAAAIRAGG